jgi:Bacterial Ig domain
MNYKNMQNINFLSAYNAYLIFLIVGALALTSTISLTPESKAIFTPGTVIVDEQFDTPSSASNSGLGGFQTEFALDLNNLYTEGKYMVLPAGTTPNTPHQNWVTTPIDSSGYFAANLQGFDSTKPTVAIFKKMVTLVAGQTYRFEMEAASALNPAGPNSGSLPNLGLEVDGVVVDDTGRINVAPRKIVVDFTATTSGSKELSIVSYDAANAGNDILVNYVKLTEGVKTPNTNPVAKDAYYTTPMDTGIQVNPLDNDTDVDSDAIIVYKINGVLIVAGEAVSIPVTNGTVTVDAFGMITCYPTAGFVGTITYPYEISDYEGGFATANEIVKVTGINKLPIAKDDSYTTPFETAVILTPLTLDTDPDGDTLTIKSIAGTPIVAGTPVTITVPEGTVDVDAAGAVKFTPKTGYTGTATIAYVIQDGKGGEATANEIIVVANKVNGVPIAKDDSYTTPFETAVILTPLTLDTDPDTSDVLSVKSIGGTLLTLGTPQTIIVTNGKIDVDAAGMIKFTPAIGFDGTVVLPYIIQDSKGGEASANQLIVVAKKVIVVPTPTPTPTPVPTPIPTPTPVTVATPRTGGNQNLLLTIFSSLLLLLISVGLLKAKDKKLK